MVAGMVSAATYTETFENSGATASYIDGSFVGVNDITWNYVKARNEGNYAINDAGLTFDVLSENSKIYSSTISGGIGSFSVQLKAATGSGDRQVELFINDISKGTSEIFNDDSIHTFEILDVNIEGNVTIRINNIQESKVVIDNIYWTDYTAVVEPDKPDEITSCSALSGVSGDLSVKIKDVNIISGFGDDDEFWYPLDEIEVEIEVENNNGDDDMDDITIEWGLYDVDAEEWVIDDEENDFNLKDGQDDTKYITFKLEDVDDLTGDDYVFYVWANAELDADTKIDVCDFDSLENIEIVNDDDFVILDDITYPSTATCGSEVQITADVWNVGDSDQDEVKVVIFNSELGINKIVEIGDINDFDNEILDTFVEIPSDAEEKTYAISLKVYDDDSDIYETDENNDESKYIIRITLEDCSVSSSALVSANLESGGKAGENLVVKSTIVNSGTKSATYTINAAGYAEWADSVSIDQTTFTIDAGASKEVLFTFDVKEDASGEKQFNIEVYSGNALVTTQPVQVEIEGTSSWFTGITGNAFVDGNKYLWGIGILNVILIVFIIIVAVRVARK